MLEFLKATRRRLLDGGGRGGVCSDSCWEDMLVNVTKKLQLSHNLQKLVFICFPLYKSKSDEQSVLCSVESSDTGEEDDG